MNNPLDVPFKDRLKSLDFGVEEHPLFMKTGGAWNQVARKALVNADTGKVMSIVSDRYKVIRYADTIVPLVERLGNEGWETIDRIGGKRPSLRIESGGARAYVELVITDPSFEVGVDFGAGRREFLLPRIIVRGSYDCSRSHGIFFGDMVKVCSNGLVAFRDIFSTSIKHVGEVQEKLDTMSKSIGAYLDGRQELAGQWSVLAGGVTDERIQEAMLVLGQRKQEELAAKATEHALKAGVRSVRGWDVYQAATEYLTWQYPHGEETKLKKEREILAILTGKKRSKQGE